MARDPTTGPRFTVYALDDFCAKQHYGTSFGCIQPRAVVQEPGVHVRGLYFSRLTSVGHQAQLAEAQPLALKLNLQRARPSCRSLAALGTIRMHLTFVVSGACSSLGKPESLHLDRCLILFEFCIKKRSSWSICGVPVGSLPTLGGPELHFLDCFMCETPLQDRGLEFTSFWTILERSSTKGPILKQISQDGEPQVKMVHVTGLYLYSQKAVGQGHSYCQRSFWR